MDRPNVLLICTDHWPGRMIGALGHPAILTPTLDQLAASGIIFTNAYTTTPMCIPARRELMTGVFSPTHGSRGEESTVPMPDLPTMAQTFRDAGYQAYGVGKLHINPPRNRIGFDDVLVHETGRLSREDYGGLVDDYEQFLVDHGYPGPEMSWQIRRMGPHRPWHLPDYYHYTDWTAREMSRSITRRDRDRPGFWYMSFDAPHPPIVPPASFLEMYRNVEIDTPVVGDWARDYDKLPFALRARPAEQLEMALSASRTREWRRAFYAFCTHADHKIGEVIETLRDEGLLENTIIMVTSDHGDMAGDHVLYNKMLFYEGSAKIPMVLTPDSRHVEHAAAGTRDDRLVAQADVMPTLLYLSGIATPDSVEGLSMVGERRREYLYGEFYEDEFATRMIRDGHYKLIYYAVGNRLQLFDMNDDPNELRDIAQDQACSQVRERLTRLLVENLYGGDLEWLKDGELVGLPDGKGNPPA